LFHRLVISKNKFSQYLILMYVNPLIFEIKKPLNGAF
jgi:hypothetical protein